MSKFRPADLGQFDDRKYRAFRRFANSSEGQKIWDEWNTPTGVDKMVWAIEELGQAPMYGLANSCAPLVLGTPKQKRGNVKQALGVMVSFILDANGFEATDRSKTVPAVSSGRVFTVARCYRRKGSGKSRGGGTRG